MSWNVFILKKVQRGLKKLPKPVTEKLGALLLEIEKTGPVRGNWPNYSRLADGAHHCHLSYRYVACWRETQKGIEVEVYYVGSRENAPY